jgi:3-methyladenine DNA glycosylase AlkD
MRQTPPRPISFRSTSPDDLCDEFYRRIRNLPVRNTPSIRAVRKELSLALTHADGPVVLDVAWCVLSGGEHRWVAYELIHEHPRAMASIGEGELEWFGRGIDSWWSVDPFALELAGPAWRERQVRDEFMASWAKSEDRWWRRAALVSTVPLNARSRGGRGDPERTLRVCALLVGDRDDMVVKALSWALRALIPHDRQAVRDFLDSHAVAARVAREVTSKLETGLKNPPRPAG